MSQIASPKPSAAHKACVENPATINVATKVTTAAPRANLSRDNASGRLPRFQDSNGPTAMTMNSGTINGTMTILK